MMTEKEAREKADYLMTERQNAEAERDTWRDTFRSLSSRTQDLRNEVRRATLLLEEAEREEADAKEAWEACRDYARELRADEADALTAIRTALLSPSPEK